MPISLIASSTPLDTSGHENWLETQPGSACLMNNPGGIISQATLENERAKIRRTSRPYLCNFVGLSYVASGANQRDRAPGRGKDRTGPAAVRLAMGGW